MGVLDHLHRIRNVRSIYYKEPMSQDQCGKQLQWEDPVSGHPQEAENVSETRAVRLLECPLDQRDSTVPILVNLCRNTY